MQQDKLISSVSHELRTPLTSIRALSDILHNNPDLDIQQRQQFLEIIMQESERLTEVVDEVIDLTELELGGSKESFAEVDLKQVVEETVKAVRNLLQEKHIKIQLRCPDEDFRIIIDRRRVMQVIITLLTNAINYCPPGRGWIGVRLLHQGDSLQVTISDNGPPVGQNNRPCLPDESRQLADIAESSPPTNLDLLISQEVIACLGGRLWAERDLQYGAKFSFCLPLEPTYQNC